MVPSAAATLALVGFANIHASESSFTCSEKPDIHLTFSKDHRLLGAFSFEIPKVADGTRHHYVEIRDGRLKSLWIVQREKIKPGSDVTFNYSFANALSWNGHRFRSNHFAFSNLEAARENPGGEAARTLALLNSKGITAADEWGMVRFVAVPDAERKHEIILSYVEPLDRHGSRLDDLYERDEETPRLKAVGSILLERARASLTIRH